MVIPERAFSSSGQTVRRLLQSVRRPCDKGRLGDNKETDSQLNRIFSRCPPGREFERREEKIAAIECCESSLRTLEDSKWPKIKQSRYERLP